MKMSIKEIKALGKSNMKLQWGASLLAIFLLAVLETCGTAIPVLGNLVVLGPLSLGFVYIFYGASQGEKINHWDIFKGFELNFGESFLATLLVNIYSILWTLLFIIPGIVKMLSYSMTTYLLARQPELSANEAITKSREYMNGNKWRYFVLRLSFIGWDILTVLTCGILAIYVLPYKEHAKMVFFNDVYEKHNAQPEVFVENTECEEPVAVSAAEFIENSEE